MTCYYNSLKYVTETLLRKTQISPTVISSRAFAARKGYREKAKKKKVKTVILKESWIPHNLRKKEDQHVSTILRSNEHNRLAAFDDVWLSRSYSWKIFDFKEAIEAHRESHHPTVYNVPDAQINLFFELDMRTAKPTKFVEKFHRMAILPNIFEQEGIKERSILAFCKTAEQKAEAQMAGADLVGGVEVIKEIEKGKVVLPDFKFVIAHPTILPEMVTIRGLLKKRFPSVKTGTLGPNLGQMVTEFKNGVEYSCKKYENMPDFGTIESTIGRLNMDINKLEENFVSLINNINEMKPKRPGPFISRLIMTTPYSVGPFVEKLKINLTPYLTESEEVGADSSDDEGEAVSAAG